MTHSEDLRAELTRAMKDGDATRISVLRTTLAAIGNAEAVNGAALAPSEPNEPIPTEVDRRQLSEDEVKAIIVGERDELDEAAEEMESLGQLDAARELRTKATVLDEYLNP
jgi:uncharacterized protein YqeY